MRPNASELPFEHSTALEKLEQMDNDLIPELYEFSDEHYVCEFIEGEELEPYIVRTGDYEFAIETLKKIHMLMYDMCHVQHSEKELRLGAEDIHSANILIKDKKPYLIDLDQFGWWSQVTTFKLMMSANIRLTDSCRTAFNLRTINIAHADAERAIAHSYESGVRHGFWNVKTKEEIKEKYERFKHLEEWYNDK